jgi:small subunit ribosomal protein S8
MIIDPISDMLTRMRNAIQNREDSVEVPASKMKEAVLRVLKQEGFIEDFKTIKPKKGPSTIKIGLRYKNDQPAIQHLERVSRPGLRIYTQADRMPRVLSGFGIAIVSTPQGVMSGKEARRKGVGGEVICKLW